MGHGHEVNDYILYITFVIVYLISVDLVCFRRQGHVD